MLFNISRLLTLLFRVNIIVLDFWQFPPPPHTHTQTHKKRLPIICFLSSPLWPFFLSQIGKFWAYWSFGLLPETNEPRCEKTGLRGFWPGLTQTRLYSHRRWLEAVTAKLICVFVLAYAKSWFSHDVAQIKVFTVRQILWYKCIHVISPYFGGSSLYFAYFWENLPTKIFRISYIYIHILYISLFRISDLSTKIQEFPSLFNHSPYLEKEISLFVFWDVSHVCKCFGQFWIKDKNNLYVFKNFIWSCEDEST